MSHRIALYSPTMSHWGGSFQYAKAVVEALALLDPQTYEIGVWHTADAEWKALVERLGFADHDIDGYTIPPQFVAVAKKILAALEQAENAEQRKPLLEQLRPFSELTVLQQWQPHVVICPQMAGQHYVQGAKQVGVIHDLMHRYEPRFPEVGTTFEITEREKLFATMVERCEAILVDSRTGQEQVLESYRRARPQQVRIVPYAAFGEVVHCVPRQPQFAVPKKYLFYSAQFWLHKNHSGLALAAAELAAAHPDLRIVAAGNMAQNGYEAFAQIVREHGLEKVFILPGYVPVEELAWLYAHARGFVMPTYFGPTNIPPLEAMALGCPVAVSGIYGMREQCGDAALYFNPADSHDIAQAMTRLWTDDALCATLVEKGKARSRLYSVDAFNKNIVRLVQGLCA